LNVKNSQNFQKLFAKRFKNFGPLPENVILQGTSYEIRGLTCVEFEEFFLFMVFIDLVVKEIKNNSFLLLIGIQKITEDILEDLSSSSGSEFEPSSSESSDDEDEDKNLLHSFKNVKKNKPFQRTPGKPRKNRPMVDAVVLIFVLSPFLG